MNHFREYENKSSNYLLSATRPDNRNNGAILSATRPSNTSLRNDINNVSDLKTKLETKSKILIYDIEGKFYVEHATAYALNLIKTRAIMLDKPKLIELPIDIHNKLKVMSNVEIEYKKIIKKPKLKVYVSNSNYFIDSSAAYSLGLLSDEEFANIQNNYYYIDSSVIEVFKEKFDIEFNALSLEKEKSNGNRLR